MSSTTLHEWSIAAFYKKAWHVTTTYKQLWLLGFAMMVFAGSSFNLNSSFDGSKFSQEKEVEAQVIEDDTYGLEDLDLVSVDSEQVDEVELETPPTEGENEGAESFNQLMTFFSDVMAKVHPAAWYIGGLTGSFFVIISLAVYVVAGPWARSALVLGVADAVKDTSPDISKNSVAALDYVRSVFFIGLVPWLAYTFFAVVSSIVALIIGVVAQTMWVGIGLGVVLVVVLFGGLVLTVATIHLAVREAVLFSTGGRIGLTRGWQAAKKGWRKSLSLMFWNIVVEVVMTIALFVPAIATLLMVVGGLQNGEQLMQLGFKPFILPAVLMVLGFGGYFIFKAAYTVFTFTTWHLAHSYLRIKTSSTHHV